MELEQVNQIVNAVAGKDSNVAKTVDIIAKVSELGTAIDQKDIGKIVTTIDQASGSDKCSITLVDVASTASKAIKVISGFPGIGKSWLFQNQNTIGIKVSDSDSSSFSWLSEGVRNPDFPNNYIKHIKEIINDFDVVMVSSHDVVRDALKEAGIEFLTVYPNINDKDEYIKRFIERGSTEAFVKLVDDNWNQWINNINKNKDDLHIELNLGEYLSDYVLNKHDDQSRLTLSISGKF